jgi:hypothetical protein
LIQDLDPFIFPTILESGLKKNGFLPEIDNANIITSGEGNSHLYDTGRFAKELGIEKLYVKQCGISHTGSFKDLGMTVLVSQVNQMRSEGMDIQAVACASTGDTSAALASYAAKAGFLPLYFCQPIKCQPLSSFNLFLTELWFLP